MKISKLIALALAAALSVTYASSCAAGENPPQSQDGASVSATDDALETRMSAMEIAQDMGIGINLGNTFDAYYEDKQRTSSGAQIIGDNTPTNYETCWGSVQTTKEIIDAFKDAGFNTIRIPVYWGNMMEENGVKYFSVASGGGTGRTLHPDNMAAGPSSYGMTDTMGRMHSDAQFAGSSSVPAHVEMMGLIGMGNNPMVGATVACAVAVEEAMKA